MKQITFDELLSHFDQSVHEAIKGAAKRTGATHVVEFVCVQMDSSRLGESTALCIGPTCTWKTVEEVSKIWLKDLPSERQYPQAFAEVPHETE